MLAIQVRDKQVRAQADRERELTQSIQSEHVVRGCDSDMPSLCSLSDTPTDESDCEADPVCTALVVYNPISIERQAILYAHRSCFIGEQPYADDMVLPDSPMRSRRMRVLADFAPHMLDVGLIVQTQIEPPRYAQGHRPPMSSSPYAYGFDDEASAALREVWFPNVPMVPYSQPVRSPPPPLRATPPTPPPPSPSPRQPPRGPQQQGGRRDAFDGTYGEY